MTILLAAIAMVDSGTPKHPVGDDCAIGPAREVSRYQVMPAVWEHYAEPGEKPSNVTHASRVARDILDERIGIFRMFTREEPTPAEVYALWSRPGMFSKRGYAIARLPKTVKARCFRYQELVKAMESNGVVRKP